MEKGAIMNEETRWPFYEGALIYLDIEKDDIDQILATHGLSVSDSALEKCRDTIMNTYAYRNPTLWIRFTATEAARKYEVPVTNVRRWAQQGQIPGATKVDNRWSFQEHEFVKRLETWRRRKPGSGQAGREVMNATEKENE